MGFITVFTVNACKHCLVIKNLLNPGLILQLRKTNKSATRALRVTGIT